MQKNNTENMTDKTFSRLILVSFVGIFICVVCLCSATWAWFVDSTGSATNVISAAGEFAMSVVVTDKKQFRSCGSTYS